MKRALVFAALLAPAHSWQQDGTSDAAVHRSRLMIAAGRLPHPDQVRVYDYVNYHRHVELPVPSADSRVSLDARLLREDLPAGVETRVALQIGIATWRPKIEEVGPVNLALVIDVSGSMAGQGRLEYVKQGLEILFSHLDADDIVSVVAFSSEARVVRAAAPVTDRASLARIVREMQPEASTNVHAGLMAGYREVVKNLHAGKANKVILLSDGETNTGVTDIEEILRQSKEFNDKGIALSTIGVGLSSNDRLMNGLAATARGTCHFLDSAEGIERTFLQELVSLLGKAGAKPRVTLRLAEGVRLYHVYGYELEEVDAGTVVFSKLLDLPAQLTQVVPVELVVSKDFDPSKGPLAEVELSYLDPRTDRAVTTQARVAAARRAVGQREGPSDPAVLKNLAIARLGAGFHEACRTAHDPSLPHLQRDRRALDTLRETLQKVELIVGPADQVRDPDIARMLRLVVDALRALE
jgi:Mg-chelatase subunit ChlD